MEVEKQCLNSLAASQRNKAMKVAGPGLADLLGMMVSGRIIAVTFKRLEKHLS